MKIRDEMRGLIDDCLDIPVVRAGTVNLGPVARRQDGTFEGALVGVAEPGTGRGDRLTKLVGGEGHFLAQRDGSRGVVEPDGEQLHPWDSPGNVVPDYNC